MKMRIDVDFYNEEERELFKMNYPNEFRKFDEVVKIGYVRVPFADFKTYSQMHHRNPKLNKVNSFRNISVNIEDLFGNVNIYTCFESETGRFYVNDATNNEQNHVTESIGCGGVLGVLGEIYGLTQADWQRIDIQGHKDFDFDSAVVENFDKMLVVECKGSIVEDNTRNSCVSSQKSKIKGKKKDPDFFKKYEHGTDLLIGGITVVDTYHHTKVLLVDPPMDSSLNNTLRFKIKLLKRLTYYSGWICEISSRSYLSIVLNNRIKVLERVENIQLFDKMSLTNAKNEKLQLSESFIQSRSNIGQKIVGRLFVIDKRKAVFFGLPIELYNIIALQDFQSIIKFKSKASISIKSIDLKLPRNVPRYSGFIDNLNIEYKKSRTGLFHFTVEDADVIQNSAGLVYSILTNKNKYSLQNE